MAKQPLLRRLVVVRRDNQRRRRPFLACRVRSMASAVELEPVPAITGTRPAAASMHLDDTLVFGVVERRRFAGRAARHKRPFLR